MDRVEWGWNRLIGRIGLTSAALVGGVLAAVPVGILAARVLGPSGKGIFDTCRYLTLGLAPVASLGLGAAGVKFIARGQATEGQAGFLILAASVVSLVPSGVASLILVANGVIPTEVGFLAALSVPAAVVAMQGSDLLRGTRRASVPSGDQVADRILIGRSLALLALATMFGLLLRRVEVFVGAWLLAWIVAAVAVLRVGCWRSPIEPINVETLRKLVGFGVAHHVPVTLAPAFLWAGIAGVGLLAGQSEAGLFGTAAAIVDTLLLVGVAVRIVGFPWLQARQDGQVPTAAFVSRVVSTGTLLLSAVAAAVVPWLIPFLYGDVFLEAVSIVWWFLPGVVMVVPAVAITVYLQATDRAARAAWAWFGTVVAYLLWIWLTGAMGGWLVAAGFSLAQVPLLCGLLAMLQASERRSSWLVVKRSDLGYLRRAFQ